MTCVHVKCVICGHQWNAPLTSEMPMCHKCMGPSTVVYAEKKRKPVTDLDKARGRGE